MIEKKAIVIYKHFAVLAIWLFGYFQQDNYKIEVLVRRLGTRL